MLELTISNQIRTFIEKLRVVEERQIYRFFRDCTGGRNRIALELAVMRGKNYIHIVHEPDKPKIPAGADPNTIASLTKEREGKRLWSTVRKLPTNPLAYRDIITAINVMIEFPSQSICWFELDDYPHDLVFQTIDDVTYDVTVFRSSSWVSKYSLEKRFRVRNLPDKEKDMTNHLAVIDDKALIEKLAPLDFAMYLMVDRNGAITNKWVIDQ